MAWKMLGSVVALQMRFDCLQDTTLEILEKHQDDILYF